MVICGSIQADQRSCQKITEHIRNLQIEIVSRQFAECVPQVDKPCTLLGKMERYDQLLAQYVILKNIKQLKDDISQKIKDIEPQRNDLFKKDLKAVNGKIENALALHWALDSEKNNFYQTLPDKELTTRDIKRAIRKYCKNFQNSQLCSSSEDTNKMLAGFFNTYRKKNGVFTADFALYKDQLKGEEIIKIKEELNSLKDSDLIKRNEKLAEIQKNIDATLINNEVIEDIKKLQESIINQSKIITSNQKISELSKETLAIIDGRHAKYLAKLKADKDILKASIDRDETPNNEKLERYKKIESLINNDQGAMKELVTELKNGNFLKIVKDIPQCQQLKTEGNDLLALHGCLNKLEGKTLNQMINETKDELDKIKNDIGTLTVSCKDAQFIKDFIANNIMKTECSQNQADPTSIYSCDSCNQQIIDATINETAVLNLDQSANQISSIIFNANISATNQELEQAKASCKKYGENDGEHYRYLCDQIDNYKIIQKMDRVGDGEIRTTLTNEEVRRHTRESQRQEIVTATKKREFEEKEKREEREHEKHKFDHLKTNDYYKSAGAGVSYGLAQGVSGFFNSWTRLGSDISYENYLAQIEIGTRNYLRAPALTVPYRATYQLNTANYQNLNINYFGYGSSSNYYHKDSIDWYQAPDSILY